MSDTTIMSIRSSNMTNQLETRTSFRTREELMINRREEFRRGALQSGGPEKLSARNSHMNNNFRRVSAFTKGDESRLFIRRTDHSKRKIGDISIESSDLDVKQIHDNLDPSAIVQKRNHDNRLAENVNGGGMAVSRIPLWKTPYFINERSQLESMDIPMYSSLCKDKTFRPHSAKALSSRVKKQRRQELDDTFDPNSFWQQPTLQLNMTQKASTNPTDQPNRLEQKKFLDIDDLVSCVSMESSLSARTARSDISSASNITATLVSSRKNNSRPTTPRTWSPMIIVHAPEEDYHRDEIKRRASFSSMRRSGATPSSPQQVAQPRRPQSAGAIRSRPNSTIPNTTTTNNITSSCMNNGRPMSARVRRSPQ